MAKGGETISSSNDGINATGKGDRKGQHLQLKHDSLPPPPPASQSAGIRGQRRRRSRGSSVDVASSTSSMLLSSSSGVDEWESRVSVDEDGEEEEDEYVPGEREEAEQADDEATLEAEVVVHISNLGRVFDIFNSAAFMSLFSHSFLYV